MKDMIEVGGAMRPSTPERAMALADKQEAPILAAREKVYAAQGKLLEVCIRQYPVGSRVKVNIAARRSPTHEVVSVNEYGWMTLRNVSTGKERGMMADSTYISPARCWYSKGGKK